ncbi:MAG: ATP-binding protein [Planctomycetota bacterium]
MTTEFEELLAEMEPLLGQKADALKTAYILGSAEARRAIEAWLQVAAAQKLNKRVGATPVLLPPPAQEAVQGPFTIGTVVYHDRELYPVGLDARALMSHIGVFGRTGTGKTNFCLALLKQFNGKGIPFLIFDWKRNYRDLLADAGNLRVYTVGRDIVPFSFQPLIPPPGTTPSIWLKLLIDVISSAYYVGEGVKFLLMKAIDAVYRETGVYSGAPKAWPSFRDILTWLEDYKPSNARESQWMISTLRTVQSLCYGEMGRVVNKPQQTPIQELLKHNAVLELDALTQTDKTFLTEALLLWIHHFRMQEGGRETLKHVIVIEEAHHLLKESETSAESIMEITLREIRELGQAIVLIDQTPSQIAPTALANTATKVFLNLPHRTDINTAAAALLLTNEQKDYLGQLPVGTAIVKLQDRYFMPFVMRIPWVRIQKGTVSDEELKRRFQPDSAHSSPDCTTEAPKQAERGRPASDIAGDTLTREETTVPGSLSKEESRLLEDILSHYDNGGVHARYRRLKMSTRRGQQLKEALVRQGIIESHDIPTPRGKVTLLQLTEQGRRLAKQLDLGPLPPRNAGPVHEFWRRHTTLTLKKQGYEVSREVRIPGNGCVDLCATRDDERLAVEIETGASDIKGNLRKALEDGFSGVVLVAVTPDAVLKVENLLRHLPAKHRQRVTKWTTADVYRPAEN